MKAEASLEPYPHRVAVRLVKSQSAEIGILGTHAIIDQMRPQIDTMTMSAMMAILN